MAAKLINFILTRTAIGQFLDGKKTLISSGLLALSALLELLEKLASIYPDYSPISTASGELTKFLDAAITTLTTVGFGGLVVGVTHKVAKSKLPEEK